MSRTPSDQDIAQVILAVNNVAVAILAVVKVALNIREINNFQADCKPLFYILDAFDNKSTTEKEGHAATCSGGGGGAGEEGYPAALPSTDPALLGAFHNADTVTEIN